MPIPKSSMPGLLLMRVRFLVPRACSARMRFSGMPHSPKPPIRIEAPSGMRPTAASASRTTLSIRPVYPPADARGRSRGGACSVPASGGSRSAIGQLLTPCGGVTEHFGEAIAACEIGPQLLQQGDEGVERGANLVGVRRGDVLPD